MLLVLLYSVAGVSSVASASSVAGISSVAGASSVAGVSSVCRISDVPGSSSVALVFLVQCCNTYKVAKLLVLLLQVPFFLKY